MVHQVQSQTGREQAVDHRRHSSVWVILIALVKAGVVIVVGGDMEGGQLT